MLGSENPLDRLRAKVLGASAIAQADPDSKRKDILPVKAFRSNDARDEAFARSSAPTAAQVKRDLFITEVAMQLIRHGDLKTISWLSKFGYSRTEAHALTREARASIATATGRDIRQEHRFAMLGLEDLLHRAQTRRDIRGELAVRREMHRLNGLMQKENPDQQKSDYKALMRKIAAEDDARANSPSPDLPRPGDSVPLHEDAPQHRTSIPAPKEWDPNAPSAPAEDEAFGL